MNPALFLSWLDATVAIGLVCLLCGLAIDAYAMWRQRKALERRNRQREAEAKRWGFMDVRGTRGRE